MVARLEAKGAHAPDAVFAAVAGLRVLHDHHPLLPLPRALAHCRLVQLPAKWRGFRQNRVSRWEHASIDSCDKGSFTNHACHRTTSERFAASSIPSETKVMGNPIKVASFTSGNGKLNKGDVINISR